MDDNKLLIHINLAERQYPLRIDRSEEERIRKAARQINDKIIQYKQRHNDNDVQDFLAWTSLQYAIKILEIENRNNVAPLIEALDLLDKKLDNILEEK